MVSFYLLSVALVALLLAKVASAFGPYGLGMEGVLDPALASNIDSERAIGHANVAENSAARAAIDRMTGNPIGAAINENRAATQTIAAEEAAGRSAIEAGLAGGLGGSALAATGANIAADSAANMAPGLGLGMGLGPSLAAAGAGASAGLAAAGTLAGTNGYLGGAYGMPLGGPLGPIGLGGFLPGSIAYGAAGLPDRNFGVRDYLLNDPSLRLQREVSRTRVYW